MHFYLNILTNLLITQYFSESRCIFVISDNNNFDYSSDIPVVDVLMTNTTFEENIVFQYYGCQGFVINTATPLKSLEYIEQGIRVTLERFNFRRYLFIPTNDMIEDVMDVFNCSCLDYIADLLVVSPIADKLADNKILFLDKVIEFEFFTHQFVGLNNTNSPVLLDTWHSQTQNFSVGNYLYPDKLSNGHGRVFRASTFEYKPYTLPSVGDGSELLFYFDFCERRNLSTHVIVDYPGEWGTIFDNWTAYGVIGYVFYDEADLALCGLCSWLQEHLFLDLSTTMLRCGITCIVPAPQLAGGWLVPLFSFTYEMWIAVGMSLLACIIALFLVDLYQIKAKYGNLSETDKNVTKLEILNESILYTIAAVLLQAIPDNILHKDLAKKCIFACMLVFSLLITIAYSSGFASCLTIPRYVGAIKTVQDLVDSGVHWGSTSNAWLASILDAEGNNFRVIRENFRAHDPDTLRTFNNKRFAFGVERLHAGDFGIGDYVTEEGAEQLRLMIEDLYWEHCVFMMRKSSIWSPAIDDFVLLMAQTGLQNYYEHTAVTNHMNQRIQRTIKFSSLHEDSSGPTKLTWEHLEGVFSIWILGIALSMLRFLVEIIEAKKK